jgi:hypothetical protein
MTLDEMMGHAADQARRVMIGTKAELTPVWLLVTGRGEIEVFATPWGNNLEKRLTIETMREVMRETRCTAYSLLTEAWMLRVKGAALEDFDDYKGLRPSESPDRQECVVTMAANKAGEHRYATFETVRNAKGKCIELRPISTSEDRWTGVFGNLLAEKRTAS